MSPGGRRRTQGCSEEHRLAWSTLDIVPGLLNVDFFFGSEMNFSSNDGWADAPLGVQ